MQRRAILKTTNQVSTRYCGQVRLGDEAACAKRMEILPRSSLHFPLDPQIFL